MGTRSSPSGHGVATSAKMENSPVPLGPNQAPVFIKVQGTGSPLPCQQELENKLNQASSTTITVPHTPRRHSPNWYNLIRNGVQGMGDKLLAPTRLAPKSSCAWPQDPDASAHIHVCVIPRATPFAELQCESGSLCQVDFRGHHLDQWAEFMVDMTGVQAPEGRKEPDQL
ncbi:hypothetical protein BD779DRAFT_1790268 [Infundibulicybe gibba]|nr:hypothetical protein BD779DRAFT_1790268 [Infundibulicybe gibba]